VLALLESPPLVGLGHFSYNLYLTHLPVLALGHFALQGRGLAVPTQVLLLLGLGMLASLAVAYVFYVLIERRFLLER
jgi:peptidoglycan/LPS O-acetylase OafA/YrhL